VINPAGQHIATARRRGKANTEPPPPVKPSATPIRTPNSRLRIMGGKGKRERLK
jgi:hypothetical protein